MRVVLLDDERHVLQNLRHAIEETCPEAEIVDTFQDPEQALEYLMENKIDLLFLDVDMPKMDGFELINEFDPLPFEVIFITAYDKYAVQAFRVSAVDYLLKPIDKNQVCEAIQKAKSRMQAGLTNELYGFFKKQLKVPEHQPPKQVAISSSDSIHIIRINEIVYCKGESNYSTIFLLNDEQLLVTRTLKDMEATLNGADFFRVHKSYLVNCELIDRFVKSDGGYVLMVDGSHVPVARSRKNKLMQYLVQGD